MYINCNKTGNKKCSNILLIKAINFKIKLHRRQSAINGKLYEQYNEWLHLDKITIL